eukprot:2145562-Prymnesium_polylepis.2
MDPIDLGVVQDDVAAGGGVVRGQFTPQVSVHMPRVDEEQVAWGQRDRRRVAAPKLELHADCGPRLGRRLVVARLQIDPNHAALGCGGLAETEEESPCAHDGAHSHLNHGANARGVEAEGRQVLVNVTHPSDLALIMLPDS